MTTAPSIRTSSDRWVRFCSGVYRPAEFRLICDAQRVYLRLATMAGQVIGLFEMQPTGHRLEWELTLDLEPGSYRYRYYAESGHVTTYICPGEADEIVRTMDGLDAIVRVPASIAPDAAGRKRLNQPFALRGD